MRFIVHRWSFWCRNLVHLAGRRACAPSYNKVRIIKLYQIFPFKVNYGTIRMELWIGCAPYRLTVFVESDHRLHSIC